MITHEQSIEHVTIRIVNAEDQRYPTAGDWYFHSSHLIIVVTDTGSWKSNMLVALHELVEVLLCLSNGITQKMVDEFDMGPGKDSADPGDLIEAPYRDQHCFAMAAERMVCAAMKLPWIEHEAMVDGS